jgi:hypothetical protein
MLHSPVQVMLQTPDEHDTVAPSPTACVHDAPEQATLHEGPQVPVQVALSVQLKLQPVVEAEQVSNPQVCPAAHEQLVPLQTVPQAETASAKTTMSIFIKKLSSIEYWRPARTV